MKQPLPLSEIKAKVADLTIAIPAPESVFADPFIPERLLPPTREISKETIWAKCLPRGIYDAEIASQSGFTMDAKADFEKPASVGDSTKSGGTAAIYNSHGASGKGLAMGLEGGFVSPFAKRLGKVLPEFAPGEEPYFPLAGAWGVSQNIAIRVLAAESGGVAFQTPGAANASVQQMQWQRFRHYVRGNGFGLFIFQDGVIYEAVETDVFPDMYEELAAQNAAD